MYIPNLIIANWKNYQEQENLICIYFLANEV